MSSNKVVLIQHIRFGISQMSPNNTTLQFEHLCRHLTKSRICSNVIPATGPIQSGGDQGRDFETFHTFLKKSPIANNSFVALISEKPIAFACSLEKNPTKKNGKIISDVKTILSGGVEVNRIYFFSGEDIAVAKRHKIQQEVRENFKVELEVIDASAISEMLSDNDTFWIANKYLNVSSEIFPRPIDSETWYEELLRNYKQEEDFSITFEVFQEIKSALRHIYKDETLKQDLPFWLEKMSYFITSSPLNLLKRSAIYEIFVASLIGLNNVDGQEDNIREYFYELPNIFFERDFLDATCLLSFVRNSTFLNNKTQLPIEEIEAWRKQLITLTDGEIDKNISPNRFCVLVEIRGQQYLNGLRRELSMEHDDYLDSLEKGIIEFRKLISEIPNAPQFPLERLSDHINHMVELLLKIDLVNLELEKLAEEIDELLGKRIGNIKAAENLRTRALTYLYAGKEILAIKILHKAKIKWHQKETKVDFILTTLTLAQSYHKINMTFAAKYYAMAGANFSILDNDPGQFQYLLKSIINLADCEYAQGGWFNYFDLLSFLLPTLFLVKKEVNLYEDDDTKSIILHASVIKYVVQRFAPELTHVVNFKSSNWGWLNEELEEVLKIAKPHYDNLSDDEFWTNIESQLLYRPFSGLGEYRVVQFSSYGIEWKFKFLNDYESNSVAEQFIANLQILIVELADDDLHLLKSDVEISIETVQGESLHFEKIPSNENNQWKIILPINDRLDTDYLTKLTLEYNAFAFAILLNQSLLPQEEFRKIMKASLDENFLSKVFFGKRYEDYFRQFYDSKNFRLGKKEIFNPPFKNKVFRSKNHSLFKWRDSVSEKYKLEKRVVNIKARYKNCKSILEITLPKVLLLKSFKATVISLRQEGWLDWQILSALANAVISYKVSIFFPHQTIEDVGKNLFEFAQLSETQSYTPIPEDVFSFENIHRHLPVLVSTLLHANSLENHNETPNLSSIQEFLNKRFLLNDVEIQELSPFNF